LCQHYGVSRTTVRLAIAEAVNEGLLCRIHGKGTFVARTKIHQPLVRITPFAEALKAQGLEPRTRLLSTMTEPADLVAAHLLSIPAGTQLIRFHLLGLGSGKPMAIQQSVLPVQFGDPVRSRLEAGESVDQYRMVDHILGEVFGWSHLQAEQTFEAAGATPEEARLLELPRGAPVFVVSSLFRNPAGRAVEFSRTAYRADQYQFHLTRQIDFRGGRSVSS
jgi:GntR family transcriptional regulator